MIVSLLLICSVLANSHVHLHHSGSALHRNAAVQPMNSSYIRQFALSGSKAEEMEKCAEKCAKEEGDETAGFYDCLFENCPQYEYCARAEDLDCDPCAAIFTDAADKDYLERCRDDHDIKNVKYPYCYNKFPSDYLQCQTDLDEKYKSEKEKCREACYGTDADDLRSFQKKCSKQCVSEFDSPTARRVCIIYCRSLSKCPTDGASEYQKKCEKEIKEECEDSSFDDDESRAICLKAMNSCERLADAICGNGDWWIIVVVVVVVVVVVGAGIAAGIIIYFLKCRKKHPQVQEEENKR